jgi:hypothetical protein
LGGKPLDIPRFCGVIWALGRGENPRACPPRGSIYEA